MVEYKRQLSLAFAKGSAARSNDNFPPFIQQAMQQYFEVRVQQSWQGHHILKGKTPTEKALLLTSNDYLHISRHPLLIQAQVVAMMEHGNGQMQSPVFLNDDSLLAACEQQFADFTGYPACLLAQSGWCANIGLIQALASRDLPVYLDFYAHMSFWEGVKVANAKPIPFQHNSVESLHRRVQRYGSGIIAIDAIYSTTGTISPIEDYVELAKKYNCLLIVDESHSLGTHGPQGSGLVADLGLSNEVDIITASLAKALSGRGGIIIANHHLIELIRYTALPTIFSSTLLPHDLAGFQASIDIIAKEEWRRKKLHDNAFFLRESLQQAGFNLGGSNSQIIPLLTGSEANTIWLRNELEKADIHGAVFCSPATPKNNALIRLSVSANHQYDELERVLASLLKIKRYGKNLPLFNVQP
ncbi:alpha-hydroxyketone-type quorum-sensing autoinducer synthase [Legionella brunensis]|uniref:Aminotransferase class II n=1 Tax=Legionella brunensis TaxID=29422 RepID=A0A0W0SP22_9GAMM|nr:alpha-hydroxyketone-type quorum-sensing autoinducer synthase [Legionella brunensis]KTC85112.1 aminotransferase class II [Legionella brunensis]